jgi:hypothetical protein
MTTEPGFELSGVLFLHVKIKELAQRFKSSQNRLASLRKGVLKSRTSGRAMILPGV